MRVHSVLRGKIAGIFFLFGFVGFPGLAIAACSLTPERATNNVGQVHGVTAHVTTNNIAAPGVLVSFAVRSGPNAGANGSRTTDASGDASFNYTGSGGAGTDILQATGAVNGVEFSCMATQVWVEVPTIQCPGNIVTNSGTNACSRSVAFSVIASGSPMPTRRCKIGDVLITSPHTFPVGVSRVDCTVSNASGTASCSFTVTVTESEPPEITCPSDIFVAAAAGEGSAMVEFDPPAATDNCGEVSVVCEPASGSLFPVGTSTVVCTATDISGNTNSCSFAVNVEETAAEVHDLAVVRIRAPRLITLSAARPVVTKRIVVTIQNRSPHTETITEPEQFANLVTLAVQSLDTNVCSDILPIFLERSPQRRLPFSLRSRQKLNVYFEVAFDCAVNSARGRGQEDFFYIAKVNHDAIDGVADTHPECDICPRPPLEGGVDPNPNGRIRDKGCGAPRGDGTLGNDVLTDIFVR
jgi:hypothetical protein